MGTNEGDERHEPEADPPAEEEFDVVEDLFGEPFLTELIGGPLDGNSIRVHRNLWEGGSYGDFRLPWRCEPRDDIEPRPPACYVPRDWRGHQALVFDGYDDGLRGLRMIVAEEPGDMD